VPLSRGYGNRLWEKDQCKEKNQARTDAKENMRKGNRNAQRLFPFGAAATTKRQKRGRGS